MHIQSQQKVLFNVERINLPPTGLIKLTKAPLFNYATHITLKIILMPLFNDATYAKNQNSGHNICSYVSKMYDQLYIQY